MPLRRRNRIVTAIVGGVALVLIGGSAFSVARSVGLFHENIAETGFRPIAEALRASGSNLVCDQGDPGYGPDNTSPWYKAVFAAPRSVSLPDRVMEIAAKEGFMLSELRLADLEVPQKLYQGTDSMRTLTVATYRNGATDQNGATMSDCTGSTAARDRPMLIELSLEYPSNTTGAAAPVEVKSTEPAPDRVAWYDAKFGTFDTTMASGSGAGTVAIPVGARAGLTTITHTGSAKFSVFAVDSNGASTGDVLVDTLGDYSGVRAFGVQSTGTVPSALVVDADGPWRITIAPLATAPPLALPTKGAGDRIYRFDEPSRTFTLEYRGSLLFELRQISGPRTPIIVAFDSSGSFSGKGSAIAGPSILVLHSDGNWAIRSRGDYAQDCALDLCHTSFMRGSHNDRMAHSRLPLR